MAKYTPPPHFLACKSTSTYTHGRLILGQRQHYTDLPTEVEDVDGLLQTVGGLFSLPSVRGAEHRWFIAHEGHHRIQTSHCTHNLINANNKTTINI